MDKKKYVEAEDFSDQNVIIHSFPLETVSLFSKLLLPEKVNPRKIIQIQVTEAVVQMVKAGMGIQVVAKWALEPYLHDKGLAIVRVTKKD